MNAYQQMIFDELTRHNGSVAKTSARLGLSTQAVRDCRGRIRDKGYVVPDDPQVGCPCGYQVEPDPTPDEIAAMCATFREGWGSERKRRYESPPVTLNAFTMGRIGRERIYKMREL